MKKDGPCPDSKVLQLFKNLNSADIILNRLHGVNEILNDCEEDPYLDIVQNKVIEAIDWYERYCHSNGYEIYDP